jgi:23S rRNA (uracil1939-C5)-methyltransferase
LTATLSTDVRIDGLATDGRGAARVGETVYFVAGALPGDRVRVRLHRETRPPSGELEAVIEPSPFRVEHPCPHAGLCSASPWGWFAYEKQLEHKRALIERTLRKAFGDVTVLPCAASPKIWHYRNRLMLTVWTEDNRIRIGYQRVPRSFQGVRVRTCKLGAPPLNALLHRISLTLETLDASSVGQVPRRIQIHDTTNGAGLMLVFSGPATDKDMQAWSTYLRTADVTGGIWFAQGTQAGIVTPVKAIRKTPDALPMQVSWRGHSFGANPAAFTQANPGAAELVMERLHSFAQVNSFGAVWDLYGGYGSLGFALAGATHPLTVLEISSHAERGFQELGALIGNTSRRFVRSDLLKSLPQQVSKIGDTDIVVLDPSRSGAHPEVLRALGESAVRRIIYLSCNPARLGRDLILLKHSGFAPLEIQPYDFFPQTPAMEVLAILQR